jgi:hypothetical protein
VLGDLELGDLELGDLGVGDLGLEDLEREDLEREGGGAAELDLGRLALVELALLFRQREKGTLALGQKDPRFSRHIVIHLIFLLSRERKWRRAKPCEFGPRIRRDRDVALEQHD